MKYLLTLSIIIFSMSAFASNQDSVKLTAKEVYTDAKAAIKQLAEALKTPVNHVYDVLVLQQRVKSWTWLIIYIVSITVNIITWFKVIRYVNKWTEEIKAQSSWSSSEPGGLYIIPIVLSACVALTFYATIQSVVTGFINPEYGAITQIMEMIGR